MKWSSILMIAAAVGTGLMGGLFFAFSSFVMRGLCKLPPGDAITAMQSINNSVFNPWFMIAFLGTPLLCLAAAIVSGSRWSEAGSGWVVAGCAIYLMGCLLVTAVFNIPLNNSLDAVVATATDAGAQWDRFYSSWVGWNHVRSISGLLATIMIVVGLRR